MNDQEKFAAFKEELIQKNEDIYGREAREKWGDAVVDAANEKMLTMSAEEYASREECEEALRAEVVAALTDGDADGAHAARAALLHAEWLKRMWPDGLYSPDKHVALAQGYLADARFTAYYDAWAPGACTFLVNAIEQHIG